MARGDLGGQTSRNTRNESEDANNSNAAAGVDNSDPSLALPRDSLRRRPSVVSPEQVMLQSGVFASEHATEVLPFTSPRLGLGAEQLSPTIDRPLLAFPVVKTVRTTSGSRKPSIDGLKSVTPRKASALSKIGRGKSYRRLLLLAAGLSLLVLVVLRKPRKLRGGATKRIRRECDPFSEPGRLVLNISTPLYTEWRTYSESRCSPIRDAMPSLWRIAKGKSAPLPMRTREEADEIQLGMEAKGWRNVSSARAERDDPLAFLRARRRSPPTILLIGDSVDRNGLVHFCQLFDQSVSISRYDDKNVHPPPFQTDDLTKGHGPHFEGWDQRGLPHVCEIPFGEGKGIALRIMNVFHYGMDELDEFDTPSRHDWHKPGKFEDRLEQLFMPYVQQFGGPDKIDLVVLQSGIWDLALFGTQDSRAGQNLSEPLTKDHMAWWTERMTIVLRRVKAKFPKSRLVLRHMHRTGETVPATTYLTDCERIHQLRNLGAALAARERLPTFDLGHPLEGYQMFQTRVHPDIETGGAIYASALLYQLKQALERKRRTLLF